MLSRILKKLLGLNKEPEETKTEEKDTLEINISEDVIVEESLG